MDESHRYRASAGLRALNELRPVLGLELTATAQVISGSKPVPFKNILYQYPLAAAMRDGFVKEPAVATRRDFDPRKALPDELWIGSSSRTASSSTRTRRSSWLPTRRRTASER